MTNSIEKHFATTKDGLKLSLFRLHKKNIPIGPPVILAHGTYSNKSTWFSSKKIVGIGYYLMAKGWDVWSFDFRAHGDSDKGDFKHYADAYSELDLPAIQTYIEAINPQKQTWIGHSKGGLHVLAALAIGSLKEELIRKVITINSQYLRGYTYLLYPGVSCLIYSLIRLLGKFPSLKLKLGKEDESANGMIQMTQWHQYNNWVNKERISYLPLLQKVKTPFVFIAAEHDKSDPLEGTLKFFNSLKGKQHKFIGVGPSYNFQHSYSHAGIIIDKKSQTEVWPLIHQKINE